MLSDIEIAQQASLEPISMIAKQLGLESEAIIPYGRFMAKLDNRHFPNSAKNGKLILVTAINPTPAGEGKTTTSIGLADALHGLGKQAVACLREPSMGPVFGLKGGATGGGYAQMVPMEQINLHFTGDFHAISAANNLLAALIDNHIYHGNQLGIREVTWRRCMDMNDRALRRVTLHQHQDAMTGFDITVASEVMAIFCLAENLNDLSDRLGRIQIGIRHDNRPVTAGDLKASDAMAVLLKEAFKPNLVQSLEHTPVIVHGGPFANIAHGCNSVVATKTALRLAEFVVTEAGFGADLGAEKFIDIKCRASGLYPDLTVIVATIRALKYHGGMALENLSQTNMEALREGLKHLVKHIHNLRNHFDLPVLVAINHFHQDTQEELDWVLRTVADSGSEAFVCKHWAQGGAGARDLANAVLKYLSGARRHAPKFLYEEDIPLQQKLLTIAQKLYGAEAVSYSQQAEEQLLAWQGQYDHMPVCVAKTPYSFSSNPLLRNVPEGHVLEVNALRLSRGAGFIVAICGNILTMPGLPKMPASELIRLDADGRVYGLS